MVKWHANEVWNNFKQTNLRIFLETYAVLNKVLGVCVQMLQWNQQVLSQVQLAKTCKSETKNWRLQLCLKCTEKQCSRPAPTAKPN